jgi:hypothetical protein
VEKETRKNKNENQVFNSFSTAVSPGWGTIPVFCSKALSLKNLHGAGGDLGPVCSKI